MPTLLGRYRVIAELGRGSTSIVYLATVDGRSGFRKRFALKVLRQSLAKDPSAVGLFVAEARVGALLDHPNVVATLEIEDGEELPFIVMEFLDGAPLQDLVTSARIAFTPLPLHVHLAALSGALEGLGYAHMASGPGGAPLEIVHRDVSPHNVFVTASGVPKILDFGFAQTIDSPNTTLASAARVAYTSPEQAAGTAVDCRSDLFAVGVMLWEAATRRRFWPEEATKAEILDSLKSKKLPENRLSALAKTSEGLRAMITKATAPHPDDRYAAASELQADLREILSEITPPSFALRDLGQRVAVLFATDRARLQRALQDDLQNADATASERPVSTPRPERPSAPPASQARDERPSSTPPPAPAISTATEAREATSPPSEPLPSFPIPSNEPAGGRGRRIATAIGAAVVALAAGAVLSAVHSGTSERRDASHAPASTAIPPNESAEVPRAGTMASAATSVEAMPAVVPASASETPPVEASASHEPTTRALAAPRPAGPRYAGSASGQASSKGPSAPAAVQTPRGSDPEPEAPIHVSEARPASSRPPHPIDSVNPYGP